MDTREREQLHECCVVPCRLTRSGVEFCLVTPNAENRWEFPKLAMDGDALPQTALFDQIAGNAGLKGLVQSDEPLGFYSASRGNEARTMTGFLMLVEHAEEAWPQQATHRRLWCLAEEARVRIRRKPLRRFIDLALHTIGPVNKAVNGNGAAVSAVEINGNGVLHTNGNGHHGLTNGHAALTQHS